MHFDSCLLKCGVNICHIVVPPQIIPIEVGGGTLCNSRRFWQSHALGQLAIFKEEILVRHSPARWSNRLLALLNVLLSWVEHLGARSHRCGRWYRDRFYYRLVESELKHASLKLGAMVLHVGCGPLPLTALYLAERGFRVVAIDYLPAAVQSARQVVRRQSLDGRITVWEADGNNIDCSPFDAVLLSLVVGDKQKIVTRALQKLRPGACVLYRNYRGALRSLYPQLTPEDLGLECEYQRVAHALGKETIIVRQKLVQP